MILAKIRQLIFLENGKKHTLRYIELGRRLEGYGLDFSIEAVLTDDIETAVKILNNDLQKHLTARFEEFSIDGRFIDFEFQIAYTDVIDGRVDVVRWNWDKKTYSVEV